MNHVQDIFGQDWQENNEGIKLLELKNEFEQKLNTSHLVDEWNKEAVTFFDQKNLNELIFTIMKKQKFEISVNFDPKMIELFREIRHLTHSKRKVQMILTFIADDALKVFPWANTL